MPEEREDDYPILRSGSPQREDDYPILRPGVSQQPQERQDDYPILEAAPEPPEAQSQFVSGLRSAAKAVIPTTASVLGAIGAAPLGTPGGPPGMIAAGFGGAMVAGAAAQKAQDWVLEQFRGGPDIQEAINAKEHPWTTRVAGAAPSLLTLTPSTAGRQLISGIAPRLSALAERGVSAGVTSAGDVGMQLIHGEEFDPKSFAVSAATGFLAPRTRGWTAPVEQRGQQFARSLGIDVPHGTPGSKGAAGTAEEQPKPAKDAGVGDPQNKVTRSERDYPAEPTAGQPEEAPSGTNVGRVDPTLASVFEIPDSPGQKRGEAEAQRQQPGEPPAGAPAERLPAEPAPAPEAPAAAPIPPASTPTRARVVPERWGEIQGDTIAGFDTMSGGRVRLLDGTEMPVNLGNGIWAQDGSMIDPSAVREFYEPSTKQWFPVKRPSEPAPRPAVEPVPGPPAAERASKAIPLSAAEEARSKALADEVLAGKRDPNDPELAALAARKRAVGDEGKPAAAEVPQEKLDTLFDNSPHKDVIPPKQRPAYDEGARDAFADRPSRPTSDLAKRLGGIYDRGYSDASKVLFAEERALREKPGEPAPAKPTVGDQLKAQERARQEARAPTPREAGQFDRQAFVEATVKGPEATAEYARTAGMPDEQVRAEIYNAGDSNQTSEARYQRFLAAKEAAAAPAARTGDEVLRGPLTPRAAIEQRAPGQTVDEALKAARATEEPEGTPKPLGAAAAGESIPPGMPHTPSPPGRMIDAIRASAEKLSDVGRDIQMLVAPMARGTQESMAIAKDFANGLRRNRWEWSRIDQDIEKRFTPEQRKRMWDAADEESVMRQRGETSEHMGLSTLAPEERAAVGELQERAQAAWLRARDLGMVEGEGLPSYTPRMLINLAKTAAGEGPRGLDPVGLNLRTKTPQMRHRKYQTAEETEAAAKARFGGEAEIARDIRALPLATGKLEDAIAGRQLIENIRAVGKQTGADTVAEGGKPSGPEHEWFTIDHPAFRKWRPKFKEVDGKITAVKDAEGNTVFEQVPIYVRGDFEGPLRAVLTKPSGLLYKTAMDLKGKTMSLIMNSPLIHNAVEWGRALPAMPGKVATFKVYFEGNRAKNDVATMREAIDGGLVPIGKRFFNQDITSIMEEPNLTPGRSWTAKVLGYVPGLFDPKAGVAVKQAIDRAGDFWNNTLLWDRVGDLQMGLYTNLRDDLLAKGVDRQSATRAAAHWANRYAGALPQEAMSDNARKFANLLLFSRSFTLGNLGAMKDMVNGLPRDVRAQISRDIGSLDPKAEGYIKSLAMRKAVSIVMLDMGLMYAGNSLLQSGLNVMRGDNTLDDEMRGYADRLSGLMKRVREHPLSLLQPFSNLESVSATGANEPGRQDRIHVGYTKDGTAIYARNPAGKIGEEFAGYLTSPLDMLRRKLGTVTRPVWQILANDKGFGRKVYDPNPDTPAKYLKNMGKVVAHIFEAQTPGAQISAAADLVRGEGDTKLNALQAFGPVAGVTFSRGAPGGPAQGELYRAREKHNYAVNEAMPEIRRMIQRGDVETARQQMHDLGIPPGLQRFYLRTTQNPATRLTPRAVQDFNRYATPEERERFTRQRQRQIPLTPDLIQ